MTIAIIQTELSLYSGPETEDRSDLHKEKLDNTLKECIKACSNAGIRLGKITGIRVNPRLHYAWGRCINNRVSNTYEIEVSSELLSPAVPDLSLKKVIFHELCHTVKDGHGHKAGWRLAAMMLDHVYGIKLSASSSPEELGIPEREPVEAKIHYVFRCRDCGMIITRCRRSEFVDNPDRYRCGICGGKFEKL